MPRTSGDVRRAAKWASAVTLSLLAVALVGCQGEDSGAAELSQVERELATLHPGGSAAAPSAQRQAVYTRSIATLEKVARSGDNAQQSAANLLIARTQAGLAQINADEAAQIEKRLLDRATRLRAVYGFALSRNAFAAALATVDTAPERATLETAIAQVDQRQTEAQRIRSGLQRKTDQLSADAQERSRSAKAIRVQAGSLSSKAIGSSAVEAAKLTASAYELQRKAARDEVESARLTAQIEKITPRIAEQDLLLTSLRQERAQLADAKARVDQRTQDASQQRQLALADAQLAVKKAGDALDSMEEIRTGPLAQAWSEALKHAQDSAAAAGRIRSMDRAAAAIVLGDAQQRLGEIHLATARSLDRWLHLLDSLRDSDPGTSLADRFGEIRARVESELAQATKSTRDAFEQAIGSYQGASVREQDVRDRLVRIQQSLQAIIKAPGDADASGKG